MELSRNRIVILDTSVLISIFEKKIDIRDEISAEIGKAKLLVPRSVLRELKKLYSLSKGSKRRLAKAAIDYIYSAGFKIVESEDEEDVDEDLIILAKNFDAAVATLDKELINKLRKEGIEIITWKNKRFKLV
ncbi:MAG TPA: ribonuclease VapC [Thermoplasmatales archaeon]|nr:ribonuclease VapC [Thermoplasmatales archaeon]